MLDNRNGIIQLTIQRLAELLQNKTINMAKESGWWELKTTVEPSTTDLEHIASLIEQGYTEGEIVEDEEEE